MNSVSTFISAVENLCGGAYFSLVGDEDIYENITHWYVGNGKLTDSSKIPTKAEVEAEVERIKKEEVYKRQRTGQEVDGVVTTDTIYPDWGTQLDYIYHHGIEKWKTDIVDPVKAKYPKPS
jgi:hypothetical protein|tara:strand:+ start:105 stop:467 length:363 start_codon:yes stop_codon:yes gene_type:complete